MTDRRFGKVTNPGRGFSRPKRLVVKHNTCNGTEIHALMSETTSFIEYTTKDAVQFATAPWVQFPPTGWDERIEEIYQEMVDLWNEKYATISSEE